MDDAEGSTGGDAEVAPVSRKRVWATRAVKAAAVVGGLLAVAVLATTQRPATQPTRSGPGRQPGYSDRVSGHTRQQAYGPGRALRRELAIKPYTRGPGRAA